VITKGTYRHYKGSLYEVLCVAKHSETLEEMVVYKSVEGKDVWTKFPSKTRGVPSG